VAGMPVINRTMTVSARGTGNRAPGHFGVDIMGDRARKIGATFEVESDPGGGTQVVVTWSEPGEGDV
jgi:nitrate/nitrite-specific signal transduction histidine kinase